MDLPKITTFSFLYDIISKINSNNAKRLAEIRPYLLSN